MNQQNSDEIDLRYIYRRSKIGMRNMIRNLIKIVDFYVKFWIVVVILILLGVGYGLYKDLNKTEVYQNKLVVIPNVESIDYLYDKIESIDRKVKNRDSIFLEPIFHKNFRLIKSLKIEPVVDLYNFIGKDEINLDVIRVFGQNKDLTDYAENFVTSKNYKYHTLEVTIQGKENSMEIITNLLTFLNGNEHYRQYFEMYKQMKTFEIAQYEQMLGQLDSLIKGSASSLSANNSGVAVNTSSDLHELINTKADILKDLYEKKKESIDLTEPIKLVNVDYNLKQKRFFSISNKLKYPLMFLFLFSLIFLLRHILLKMREIAN